VKFKLSMLVEGIWEKVLLSDACNPKQWKTISKKNLLPEGYVVYGANGKIGYHSTYTHESSTLMITCRGATCGNLHVSEPFSYINGNAMALDGLSLKYLSLNYCFYFLKYRGLDDAISGSAQPQITRQNLSEVAISLPPLAEQKQIADKLDTLLAQVERTKTRLDAIPKILKRFRQSVLAAAVSGKLTEDWRIKCGSNSVDLEELLELVSISRKGLGIKDPRKLQGNIDTPAFSIPSDWKWVRLGSIALKITDGAHNTPKTLDSGFPYLMAKDLTGGYLDFSENRCISEKDHRELYNKCQPEVGDLLVVNIGAGTGNNVSVDVDFEFSFKNIAIIKRPVFVEPKYLKWFFDARKNEIFLEQTRGGAQPFLSLKVLGSLEFVLPPKEEQTEIVRRVEELFGFADRVEARVKKAQGHVNHLTQSILAKAFRGELPADWRKQNPDLISGENSAQSLLDKIKIEREKLKPVKKKRTAKKKKTG